MNTVNKIRTYTMVATLLVGGLFQPLETVAEDSFPAGCQQEVLEPEVNDPCLSGTAATTKDQVIKYSEDLVRASFERAGLLDPEVENPCPTGTAAITSDREVKYSEDSARASFERAGLLGPES